MSSGEPSGSVVSVETRRSSRFRDMKRTPLPWKLGGAMARPVSARMPAGPMFAPILFRRPRLRAAPWCAAPWCARARRHAVRGFPPPSHPRARGARTGGLPSLAWNRSALVRSRPKLCRSCPNLADHGQESMINSASRSIDGGPNLTNFGQIWPRIERFRPDTSLRPKPNDFGQAWSGIGQSWTRSRFEFAPMSTEMWPTRSISAVSGSETAKLGPNSTEVG